MSYTVSEKKLQADLRKEKNFNDKNETYWNNFVENSGKSTGSLAQYKSAVRRFTETIGKDILSITVDELRTYVNGFEGKTRDNQERYIKSFLNFTIVNTDISVDNNLIIELIPTEYKTLIGKMFK